MINKLTCRASDTLMEVLKVINENARGIAFVLNENKKLCGVVTDGDIRRALLKGVTLQEKIVNIVLKNFTVGKIGEPYESLIAKISQKVKTIPLVNDANEVVDFFECRQAVYLPVAIPNLGGNEFRYLTDAFMSSWISSTGEYIVKFEKAFSSFVGCEYGVSCSNGTTALHLALEALGIGEGDEVIVPDLTFAATINAVLYVGARPVIVDVEEDSWCIDPVCAERAITSRTKAIIPVHIYGQPCDMAAIMDVAERYHLRVVEDCAEAHGAAYGGQKVGSFGDVGCFSFYGNKIITTGEGGMCVTRSVDLRDRMALLKNHGMNPTRKYWHDVVGYNYRMTNLQAAIGLAQLERIDEIICNRKKYEEEYRNVLSGQGISFQKDLPGRDRVVWLVSVLLERGIDREGYFCALRDKGFDTRPFFYPLSDMEIYQSFCNMPTPVSHKLSEVGLNLPTYESLKNIDEIQRILKCQHSKLPADVRVKGSNACIE